MVRPELSLDQERKTTESLVLNLQAKTMRGPARDQDGFTLIELLVVVGIIVALAAVAIPALSQFSDRGDQGAAAAEWDAIQRAIGTMMSEEELTTVTAGASNAFITDTLDFDAGSGAADLAGYMRDVTTSYCYTWDATGQLLTQVEPTGNPSVCP